MIRNKAAFSRLVACLTLALPVAFFSAAVSGQTDDINQCRIIQDGVKRLACFDNLFGRLYIEQTTTSLPAASALQAADLNASEQVSATQTNIKSAEIGVPDADVSEIDDIDKRAQALIAKAKSKTSKDPFAANKPRVSANNKPQVQASDDNFGAESMPVNDPKIIDEIQISIADLVKDSKGYATFTLSNGQVWRQTEAARFEFNNGETVTIKKGVFNSFYLSKLNNNRSVRVKRIQ